MTMILPADYHRPLATKASLESRGLATATSAAALVALLLGMVSLVEQTTGRLAAPLTVLLVAGLALLVASGALALLSYAPSKALAGDPDAAAKVFDDRYWSLPAAGALREIASMQLEIWRAVQSRNERKARLLTYAIGSQVGALAVVAVAAILLAVR